VTEASLLGDIGGTNARFALLTPAGLSPMQQFKVAEYPALEDAVVEFLRQASVTSVGAAYLGIAAPVDGDRCKILNSPWVVDAAALCKRFGFRAVELVNDFEAVALSLPHLRAADLFDLGGGAPRPDAPLVVLGPGTGFGLAALIPHGGRMIPIATEGGHGTLPAESRREDAIVDVLRRRFGHVSIERALSGPGLENLYRAIAAIDGVSAPARDAQGITDAALAETCDVSRAALDLFCELLGGVAGNFALTFRARGGVFVAGGIAPRIAGYLAKSSFRARFEAKGRFEDYLKATATNVIVRPDPAFLGLKALAERIASDR
jgi:glucokinase